MAKSGLLLILAFAAVILSSLVFQPSSVPPSGCYYLQVQCVRAPCNPVLVCPTPPYGPSPTCTPRPRCLDTNPRCLLPETPDMCPPSTEPATSSKACKTGGCNGELCLDTDSPDIVSICLWKDEHACYQYSRCERQPNGQCAWTQTPQYLSCLQGI